MATRAKRPGVRVGVLMGSDSDWEVMAAAARRLADLKIPYEVRVASAHRSPAKAAAYASQARSRGVGVLIVGAGGAAHLAGLVAANTTLPVIGVPLDATSLHGLDALLATVQMPAGVPVATMAVGTSGADNAAIFAAQILAGNDRHLAKRLEAFKKSLAEQVDIRNARFQQERGTL